MALLNNCARAALAVAGFLSASGVGAAGVAHASPPPPNPNLTGQVVYLVNNSSAELMFGGVERSANIASQSDSVLPGETGYVKSTSADAEPSVMYVIGDLLTPAQSVYITSNLDDDGTWLTICHPSGGLACTVSAPVQQGNWPVAVAVEDRVG